MGYDPVYSISVWDIMGYDPVYSISVLSTLQPVPTGNQPCWISRDAISKTEQSGNSSFLL